MREFPVSSTPRRKESNAFRELIYWYTVSYKAVALWLISLLILVFGILVVVSPHWWVTLVQLVSGARTASDTVANQLRQIRFTDVEGEVRVRKASHAQWAAASLSMDLSEGDTIQTLHDAIARIAFSDGTFYVVKPDTLIVLEESGARNDPQLSNVAVKVSSGEVNLSTARGSPDSRVLFANAEARIHQESRAWVTSDPQTNLHQISVSTGGASLVLGGKQVELAQLEQASFAGPGSAVVKARIVGPPILLTPAHMAPVVLAGSQPAEVEFTWNTVPGADSYRIRVSSSAVFSTVLYDRKVQSTLVRLPAFKEGNYYWSVATIDAGLKESQPSEANQFSVIRQEDRGELPLVVEKYVQYGRRVEIIGRTEPGATVLVNNEPVFSVAPDGSFKHFTAPLPNLGPNQVTITAQDSKGKIATLRKKIIIE